MAFVKIVLVLLAVVVSLVCAESGSKPGFCSSVDAENCRIGAEGFVPPNPINIFGDKYMIVNRPDSHMSIFNVKEPSEGLLEFWLGTTPKKDDTKLVFKVRATDSTRDLLDAQDVLIGSSREDRVSTHHTIRISGPDGTVVGVLKKDSVVQVTPNANVYKAGNEKSGQEFLSIKGAMTSFMVYDATGGLVAEIARLKGLSDKEPFIVMIAPNVDVAFMSLLVVSLDSMFQHSLDSLQAVDTILG